MPGASSACVLQRLLHRLIGLLGPLGIKAAELGHLVEIAVVGPARVAGLDFHGLLHRLCREQLFEGGRTLFEGALGIVRHLRGNGLPTLAPLTKHLHGSVHVVLTEFLEIFDVLQHWNGPISSYLRGDWKAGVNACNCLPASCMHCTKKVNTFAAMQHATSMSSAGGAAASC